MPNTKARKQVKPIRRKSIPSSSNGHGLHAEEPAPGVTNSEWRKRVSSARSHLKAFNADVEFLRKAGDDATSELMELGRESGIEVNRTGVQAIFQDPYILLPTDDSNIWRVILIRVRKDAPVVGWVESSTDGYVVSTIRRGLRFLTDIPEWMVQKVGWTPPEFSGALDPSKDIVRVTHGDAGAFQKRYAAFLRGPVEGGFRIKKGKAWIDLLDRMLNDGILPFQPTPVNPEHWNAEAPFTIDLRDYQRPYVDQFLRDGAESVILPPGGGKTVIALYCIAHLKGHQTILADSDVLVGQWKARLKEFAPNADVEVLTFQAAMHRIETLKGVFMLVDEGHRLPADTWSRLGFTQYTYRMLMTATPWRLKRPAMVFALGGPPRSIPWDQLIKDRVLKAPTVRVMLVPDKAFKLQWIKHTLAAHPTADTLLYSDSIAYGKELAAALQIPFIHGETKHKYERVTSERVRIVSKAIEASIHLEHLSLVIEADVSRTGESRISEGQRIGRLLHSTETGEYYILWTPDEYHRFHGRLLEVEKQLGDIIEYVDLTGHAGRAESPATSGRGTLPSKRTPPEKPADEIGTILAHPRVAKAIQNAYDHATDTVRKERKIEYVLRLLWEEPLTEADIRAAKGLTSRAMSTYRSALNAALQEGLVAHYGDAWSTNKKHIQHMIRLSERTRVKKR